MATTPPHGVPAADPPRRRNRTRQRERILEWLRGTDSHPTAAQIHEALLPEFGSLSLGTVYRNLEVLVAEGEVDEVPSASGAVRYDGNPRPHHHFTCSHCGRIVDVEVPVPRSLARRLDREHGLRAERISIDFFGLCSACEAHVGSDRSRGRSG